MRYWIYAADTTGPLTGLTPAFDMFKNATTLATVSPAPTIAHGASGLYYFDYTVTSEIIGRIDLGVAVTALEARYRPMRLSTQDGSETINVTPTYSQSVTLTILDGASAPIPDANVQILNSGQTLAIASGKTNASGVLVTALDAGSYKVRLQKAMVNFTVPETLTVAGTTTQTYTGAIVHPTSPAVGLQTIYGYIKDLGLNALSTPVIRARLASTPQDVSGVILSSQVLEAAPDALGYFELGVAKTAVVTIEVLDGGRVFASYTITIDSNNTKLLTDY